METTAKTGLRLAVFALFCTSLVLAGVGGLGTSTEQEIKMPAITKTHRMNSVSDCALDRCQQLCEEHYGNTKLDVSGTCDGDGCNCGYREPCRPMACYNKCLNKYRGKLNLHARCLRHECFCKYDNYCERAVCTMKCRNAHPGKKEVKGICVGQDCSCRWK